VLQVKKEVGELKTCYNQYKKKIIEQEKKLIHQGQTIVELEKKVTDLNQQFVDLAAEFQKLREQQEGGEGRGSRAGRIKEKSEPREYSGADDSPTSSHCKGVNKGLKALKRKSAATVEPTKKRAKK